MKQKIMNTTTNKSDGEVIFGHMVYSVLILDVEKARVFKVGTPTCWYIDSVYTDFRGDSFQYCRAPARVRNNLPPLERLSENPNPPLM